MDAMQLLADVIGWKKKEVQEALYFKDTYYKLRSKRKKSGALRKLYAPHPKLKKLQRKFLKYFLYRIQIAVGYNCFVCGFRPNFSYVDNAKIHALKGVNFVLRMDLKDAFPSVKIEHLRSILKDILYSEIESYAKGRVKWYQAGERPFFPIKRTRWFRKLVKGFSIDEIKRLRQPVKPFQQLSLFKDEDIFDRLFDDPLEILERLLNDFIELVLSFTTYQGELPQGAPTSPYLLNIVLSYSGLLKKISKFLRDKKVLVFENTVSLVVFSVYADDLTISSSEPIHWSIINKLIELIEQESDFKINHRKTLYFDRNRISPLITGLRLVKLIKSPQCLENVLETGNSSLLSEYERRSLSFQIRRCLSYSEKKLTWQEKKNFLRRTIDDGQWIIDAVGLPKKEVRRIRGLIHRAIFDKTFSLKVVGHIANLKPIYGDKLPRQIAVPYQKYLDSL